MILDDLIAALVGRWLRRKRRSQTGAGQMVVFCPDTIGDAILINGFYEHKELNALAAWLADEHRDCLTATALDVGANIGNHTRYFSGLFEHVMSFEPNPAAFRLLKINVESCRNTEVFNIGLGDQTAAAKMVVPAMNRGGARVTEEGGLAVQLKALDEVDLRGRRIGLIKIDVEGYENKVLLGGEQTIREHRPIVAFESLASSEGLEMGGPIATLQRFGYRHFFYVGAPAGLRRSRLTAWLTVFARFRVRRLERPRGLSYPMIIAVH